MLVSLRRRGKPPSSFVRLGADRPLAVRETPRRLGELTGGAANTQIPRRGCGHTGHNGHKCGRCGAYGDHNGHKYRRYVAGVAICCRLWSLPDSLHGSSRTSQKTVAARSSPIERETIKPRLTASISQRLKLSPFAFLLSAG